MTLVPSQLALCGKSECVPGQCFRSPSAASQTRLRRCLLRCRLAVSGPGGHGAPTSVGSTVPARDTHCCPVLFQILSSFRWLEKARRWAPVIKTCGFPVAVGSGNRARTRRSCGLIETRLSGKAEVRPRILTLFFSLTASSTCLTFFSFL